LLLGVDSLNQQQETHAGRQKEQIFKTSFRKLIYYYMKSLFTISRLQTGVKNHRNVFFTIGRCPAACLAIPPKLLAAGHCLRPGTKQGRDGALRRPLPALSRSRRAGL
jgi:hypothetical protein